MKYIITTLLSVLFFTTVIAADQAHASFNAGRIIDDAVMADYGSMNVADIQRFLESKVTCDTWGTKPSEYGGGTRAQYAASRGWQSPPYYCMTTYVEGGKSAAQLVYDKAQKYRISPKVLIVLLQKEQGLITDEWPLYSPQYKTATGYGCPDTAPCDSQYFGLGNQLDWAAKMFRSILDNSPGWYTPYVLGTNYIQYNPDASCGGGNVNIENRATQALYNYTPYQPNKAALDAGWGQAPCGAYGNRNFYLYFTNWFGSIHNVTIPGCKEATNTSLSCIWKLIKSDTGAEVLSSSHAEVTNLVSSGKYQYVNISWYGRNPVSPQAGNIPVYALGKNNSATFLTTNKNEYDNLKAAGYLDKGIIFYADPVHSNSGYPVYRLHNPSAGAHVWVSSKADRNKLVSSGYIDEGVAFTSLSKVRQEVSPVAGQNLLYRFSSMPGNSHFWTKDIYERDSMIQAGYRYEGVAWKISAEPTTAPVYRLYSPTMKKHLFTRDANERKVLSSTSSWEDEGIAYYVSPVATSKPVYRLYSSITTNHLLTSDANERKVLIRNGTFRDEGIAYYGY